MRSNSRAKIEASPILVKVVAALGQGDPQIALAQKIMEQYESG